MRLKKVGIVFSAIIAAIGIITASTDSDTFVHQVKKGESLSLICIDYYGYYSKELGEAIKRENPVIKDVNLIKTGSKLTLRKPQITESTGSAKEETTIPDTLFVKKIAVTQGVVTCIEGDVRIKRQGSNTFSKLTVNSILNPGDIIQTAASSRAEIVINRESVVRLNEKTEMTLEALRDTGKEDSKTRIGFPAGSIWTKMKQFKDKISRFELELPTAIAAVHGTVYQTSVYSDSSSEVKVYSGEVAVRNAARKPGSEVAGVHEISGPDEIAGPQEVSMDSWTQIVRSMQKIRIDKFGVPSKPLSFSADSTDSWEKWNEERDKRIAEMFMEQPR